MKRFSLRTFFIAFTALALFVAVNCWFCQHSVGRSDYRRLLAGDDEVELANVTFRYGQREVKCSDETTLSYFTSVMLSPDTKLPLGSMGTHKCDAVFSTGHRHSFTFFLRQSSDSYHFSFQDGSPVGLVETYSNKKGRLDVPPKTAMVLDFLTAPRSDVAGLRMTVTDDNHSSFQYDKRLAPGGRGDLVELILSNQAIDH